jgi:hypothetical protein
MVRRPVNLDPDPTSSDEESVKGSEIWKRIIDAIGIVVEERSATGVLFKFPADKERHQYRVQQLSDLEKGNLV